MIIVIIINILDFIFNGINECITKKERKKERKK
jgi:hypothetical protein